MMKRRGKSTICGALSMLIGLASRRYGLTLKELMQEAKVSRSGAYRHLEALEAMGVEFKRQKEAIRGGWVTNYKLVAIRGLRFEIKRGL